MADRRRMTEQRRTDPRRRPGDPRSAPRHRDTTPRDPGAYIGRMPERATETIPGGLGPKDERVSAVGTQPGPVRGDAPASDAGRPPEGHREGENATDDRVREAGQNR
jgi:hypothetical protein